MGFIKAIIRQAAKTAFEKHLKNKLAERAFERKYGPSVQTNHIYNASIVFEAEKSGFWDDPSSYRAGFLKALFTEKTHYKFFDYGQVKKCQDLGMSTARAMSYAVTQAAAHNAGRAAGKKLRAFFLPCDNAGPS